MHRKLNSIINNYSEFVFVSPHLDDALLSCAQLISELVKENKKVKVINVFTKAHNGPYTLSAKAYLKVSGNYINANKLYKDRVEEDSDALSYANVNKVINLNLTDALFRKKNRKGLLTRFLPELSHLYPTYRWHILNNKLNRNDNSKQELADLLEKSVSKKALVFAPKNIANHIDHQIVKEVCEEKFKNIVLYADFPYSLQNNTNEENNGIKLKVDLAEKSNMLSLYKTQLPGLFPDATVPNHSEIYYLN